MKNILKIMTVVAMVSVLSFQSAWAGNDNRRGTAGATELLINPWARSAGWGSVSIANVRGLDAFYSNIAGLAFTRNFEGSYSNTIYLGGKSGSTSGASINAFGLGVRLFESGVAGVSIMTMGFGDIDITTVDNPEGTAGTFSPSFMNIAVGYSHSFTRSIHGGAAIRIITESTDNISAQGFSLDAGIQYVTGADDELKFGISLKNIGTAMHFSGTGHSLTMVNDAGNNFTVETRSAEMELPTCLNIGISYDFLFNEKWAERLTVAGSFTSNAFLKDNFALGLEYAMLGMVELRAGYVYQTDIFSESDRTTANTGLCAGASVEIPLGKKDSNGKSNTALELDYSFRSASPLKGTHSIGGTLKF